MRNNLLKTIAIQTKKTTHQKRCAFLRPILFYTKMRVRIYSINITKEMGYNMAKVNSDFEYQHNINGKLALGYGSKYQLLRMLGWHREAFTNNIKKAISYNGDIKWLDFQFNGHCDDELLNVDFIPSLKSKWRAIWACGNKGLNWDAVGIADDGTFIFVEAKANLSEFSHKDTDKSTSPKSKQTHLECIRKVIEKYAISCDCTIWSDKYYQIANRIVLADFMIENGYKAKLVYVLFENGFEYNCQTNKSVSSETWNNVFDNALKEMGIKGTRLEALISRCVINCNP